MLQKRRLKTAILSCFSTIRTKSLVKFFTFESFSFHNTVLLAIIFWIALNTGNSAKLGTIDNHQILRNLIPMELGSLEIGAKN